MKMISVDRLRGCITSTCRRREEWLSRLNRVRRKEVPLREALREFVKMNPSEIDFRYGMATLLTFEQFSQYNAKIRYIEGYANIITALVKAKII